MMRKNHHQPTGTKPVQIRVKYLSGAYIGLTVKVEVLPKNTIKGSLESVTHASLLFSEKAYASVRIHDRESNREWTLQADPDDFITVYV